MGLVIGLGALLYITTTTFISLRIVAPTARLANIWDTRLGGALADAVSCNAVVKAFGAERREEVRIDSLVRRWRDRTRRTWKLSSFNAGLQGLMMLLTKAGVMGTGVYLWQSGSVSAGDITFVHINLPSMYKSKTATIRMGTLKDKTWVNTTLGSVKLNMYGNGTYKTSVQMPMGTRAQVYVGGKVVTTTIRP